MKNILKNLFSGTPTVSSAYDEVIDKRIEDIMDSFDFDKVYRVMEMLDWKWASAVESEDGVPTKYELRKFAREFLKRCAERRESSSTGGFSVQFRQGIEDGKNWVDLNLSFEVESTYFDGEFYSDEVKQ